MDIERIEELLPWLANDTLTPDERQEVVAYLAGHPEARHAVEATAFALASLGGHPDEQALLSVARDEAFDQRQAVVGHLAGCADCAEAVALARVAHATPIDGRPATVLPGPTATPTVAPGQPTTSRRAPDWRTMAVAAAIAIALGCLGWWHGSRSRTEAPQSAIAERPPSVAPSPASGGVDAASLLRFPLIVAVSPSTLRERGRPDAAVLALAEDRDTFIIDVQLPKAERAVEHLAARLERADGTVLPLTVGPRAADDPDLVAVPLPAALLAPATAYDLVILDAAADRELDRYPLRTEDRSQ